MMRKFFAQRRKKKTSPFSQHMQQRQTPELTLSPNLADNLELFRTLLGNPHDLLIRTFLIGNTNHTCAVIALDGLADSDMLHNQVLGHIQLMISTSEKSVPTEPDEIIQLLFEEVLSVVEIKKETSLTAALDCILSGDTALFVDGSSQLILIDSKGWKTRGIEEPVSEGLVRGPRDGFTESIRDNTVRIRRRVKDPNLRFESSWVGIRSKTELIIAYIDDIVDHEMLDEVRRRIATIDIDEVEESGFIEQWIEDDFLSPFPQAHNTERPDKVSASLFQGRVAILLDGTPMVLILPVTIGLLLHSPEDYYERWIVGTLARLLRYLAAFFAVFSPSLYIALVTFHPGLIPSDLAFSIAATRDGVPFPAFIESIMMITTMELLQEAGLRLPKPIGQTVGIVGGLVIGDAAVSAGIVSPVMVIVVALTAISSFAIPSFQLAIAFRMIRFFAMFGAAIFGIYGVILSLIAIMIHLSNLTSIGYPYLAPFAPQMPRDWKDLILRAPVTFLKERPQALHPEDEIRMRTGDSK
ncbi:spore germination protein [Brevibacillus parabrevis]|uniref:spore germination protein n=1 Tax=Brevibacillus parabrevis TaxID=54914 RepID=UPI00238050C1|nr:spore germination protein [Brevibacillus parabrevis]WDV94016.1 spore germination protein [Brevibacillus parabrevis]